MFALPKEGQHVGKNIRRVYIFQFEWSIWITTTSERYNPFIHQKWWSQMKDEGIFPRPNCVVFGWIIESMNVNSLSPFVPAQWTTVACIICCLVSFFIVLFNSKLQCFLLGRTTSQIRCWICRHSKVCGWNLDDVETRYKRLRWSSG